VANAFVARLLEQPLVLGDQRRLLVDERDPERVVLELPAPAARLLDPVAEDQDGRSLCTAETVCCGRP
jgi:hypothetical protein